MSQPPPPSAPQGPQHDERSGRSGGSRRPNPAAVAVILLFLVLLLSLGAFLGVRAVLGADSGGRATSVVQVAGPIPQQGRDVA